jgi:hypothetical protein
MAIDMFLSTPLGLSALAYLLTGFGVGVFQGGVVRETKGIGPVLAAAGGLVGGAIFVLVGGIAGEDGFFTLTSVKIVVVAAAYDALIAPLVFLFVHWANHDPDRMRGWR